MPLKRRSGLSRKRQNVGRLRPETAVDDLPVEERVEIPPNSRLEAVAFVQPRLLNIFANASADRLSSYRDWLPPDGRAEPVAAGTGAGALDI